METYTEIVKEKLKGCGKKFTWAKCEKHICGEDLILPSRTILKGYYLCPICKATLSGMQTAIKSELEFLEERLEDTSFQAVHETRFKERIKI